MILNASAQLLNQNYFGQKGEMKNPCHAMIHFLFLIKELSRHSLRVFFFPGYFYKDLENQRFWTCFKENISMKTHLFASLSHLCSLFGLVQKRLSESNFIIVFLSLNKIWITPLWRQSDFRDSSQIFKAISNTQMDSIILFTSKFLAFF